MNNTYLSSDEFLTLFRKHLHANPVDKLSRNFLVTLSVHRHAVAVKVLIPHNGFHEFTLFRYAFSGDVMQLFADMVAESEYFDNTAVAQTLLDHMVEIGCPVNDAIKAEASRYVEHIHDVLDNAANAISAILFQDLHIGVMNEIEF